MNTLTHFQDKPINQLIGSEFNVVWSDSSYVFEGQKYIVEEISTDVGYIEIKFRDRDDDLYGICDNPDNNSVHIEWCVPPVEIKPSTETERKNACKALRATIEAMNDAIIDASSKGVSVSGVNIVDVEGVSLTYQPPTPPKKVY
jgi:hypothetical protein